MVGPEIGFPPAVHAAAWTWDEMIAALRRLGGAAENIAPGSGRFGRGLFAREPSRPIHLHLPPTLLFSSNDIEFVSDRIRLKDSAAIGDEQRCFFENYQRDFSWGLVGEGECAAFIDEMERLPSQLQALLSTEFGLKELFQGDRITRIQNWFVKSRTIAWKGNRLAMPVIELANHAPDGLRFEFHEGLRIQGQSQADGEVLVSYGAMDALRLFGGFGFASPADVALSLPVKLKIGDIFLTIGLDTYKTVKRGQMLVPALKLQGGDLVLSHLMIGNIKAPRLCRGIFRALMRDSGISESQADEAFDRILHFNRVKFLKLLAALETQEGAMIVTLRKVARFALEAMSHCIGSRQLEEPASFHPGWRVSLG